MSSAETLPEKVPMKTKDKNVDEKCVAFGKRLESSMRDAELTQAEVARLMGVSRSAVNWWVQGLTYPSVEKAERLGKLLRVTPEYLIYGVRRGTKDRLIENIPVYESSIHGVQRNISQIGIPKDFIARNIPNAGELRGVSMAVSDATMIVITDATDRTITEDPKRMLIQINDDGVMMASVKRSNRSITISIPGSGESTLTESEFDKRNLVIGHVVAELHTGRT